MRIHKADCVTNHGFQDPAHSVVLILSLISCFYSSYRSHTLKPIYSLSDTHTREHTCRKRWLCISRGTCWQCSDALFPFDSEKDSCSHWGINASSLDPLSQICWKQEKDVPYKTATHSSEWPVAVEPVPRGKWRCVYLRVRRNEVRMPRTRHAIAV